MGNTLFMRCRAVILVLGVVLSGGFVCAVAQTASQTSAVKTAAGEGEVVLTDEILAFARPDAAMAKSVGKVYTAALLGVTHTYLLRRGGPILLSMAQLDSARLTLTPDSHKLFLADKTVWGTLEFTYASDASTVTDEEQALFRTLGFSRVSPQTVRRAVDVQGVIYPAIELQGMALAATQKPRPLHFRAPLGMEAEPDLDAMAPLPVAIMVDALTAPVRTLGGLVFILNMDPRH